MKFIVGALAFAMIPAGLAQSSRVVGQERNPNQPDVAEFTLTPVRQYTSLKDLVEDSDLVVEGDVAQVLAARETNPHTHSLATDMLFKTIRVLKGANLTQVLVFQNGGSLGVYQRIPKQFHLMKEGEHYILFLTRDRHQTPSPTYGSLYEITGGWPGLFKVNHGQLELSPATHPDLQNRYEGKAASTLLSDIKGLQ